MTRRTWLTAALAALLALGAWIVSHTGSDSEGSARPKITGESAPDLAQTGAPPAPTEVANTLRESTSELRDETARQTEPVAARHGSLTVRLAGREPLDRLHLIVRGPDRRELDSRDVDADQIVFAELPTGPVRVELSSVLGATLNDAQTQVNAGEQALVTLDWPAPLPDRRRRTIRGEVRVPLDMLREHPMRGAQLELAALLDSDEQEREAPASRFARIDQLAYGQDGARRFEFAGLPQGSYELRIWPVLVAKTVTLSASDLEVDVRFECGPIGRALLNFEDSSGATLRPRSVRARPAGDASSGLHAPVLWNERYLAYDFAALSAEYDFELEFDSRARSTLRWSLEPGWSEHRLPTPSHGPIQVELLDAAQDVRVGDFSAAPDGDGRVLSLRLLRANAARKNALLELTVDRIGSYRIRFERDGRRTQSIAVTASPLSSDAPQSAPVIWRLE